MARRKYARMNEPVQGYECCNKKCKWQGNDEDKSLTHPDGDGFQKHVCPKCGNDEFYGLLEFKK
jgi:hypothetical protein